ncbi:MAG: hypothetical protein U0169_15820 [Polyangiaceae bacterium]
MSWTVVYDFASAGFRGAWVGALSAAFALAAVACVLFRERLASVRIGGGKNSLPGWLFGVAWFGIATFVSASFFASLYANDRELRAALREGRAADVEGPIRDLRVTGVANHETTTFTVGGVTFESRVNDLEGGFHDDPGPDSVLREGTLARVHHVGNRIVRLEVGERGGASPR